MGCLRGRVHGGRGDQPLRRGRVAHLRARAEHGSAATAPFESTSLTALLAIRVSFVGVIVVTFDFILFGIVLCVCFGLIGLTFFISVICGWGLGPVEAIGLIFFLGYAETYALHVTYRYASSTLLRETVARIPTAGAIRLHWARNSMKSIGKASLGSAITAVLSAFFLLSAR